MQNHTQVCLERGLGRVLKRADSQSRSNCQIITSNQTATESLKVGQKVKNLCHLWDKCLSLKSLFSAQLHIQKSNTLFSLLYETKKANQQTLGRVSKVGMLPSQRFNSYVSTHLQMFHHFTLSQTHT